MNQFLYYKGNVFYKNTKKKKTTKKLDVITTFLLNWE